MRGRFRQALVQASMDTSPAVVRNTHNILLEVRIVLRLYSGASRGVSVANFVIISERITPAWEMLAKLMELVLRPIRPAPKTNSPGRTALGELVGPLGAPFGTNRDISELAQTQAQ